MPGAQITTTVELDEWEIEKLLELIEAHSDEDDAKDKKFIILENKLNKANLDLSDF